MNENVTLYLQQGDLRLSVTIPKKLADRMSEIILRDRSGDWRNRMVDLLNKAGEELEMESHDASRREWVISKT